MFPAFDLLFSFLCFLGPHPSHVKLHFLEKVIQNYYCYGANTSTLLFFPISLQREIISWKTLPP